VSSHVRYPLLGHLGWPTTRNHIFDGEFFDRALHEGAPYACSSAVLKIVQLADDIAR
jgi:hypothetical protein